METDRIALLDSLIDDARAKREKVDGQIALLEEELKELRKCRMQLRDEEVVLTGIIFRRTASSNADAPANPSPSLESGAADAELPIGMGPSNDWSVLGRAEAVEAAVTELTAAKGFATPAEIEQLLMKRNRSGDTRDYIGASLAYLRRSGKAHTRARAEWLSGPEPLTERSPSGIPSDRSGDVTATNTQGDATLGI